MEKGNEMAKRLIDAEDVKELLKGLDSLPWEEEVDILVDRLETVELPVRGKWKEATRKNGYAWSSGYARCSNCEETIWCGWKMNFCPNCGADMRGEKND